MFIIQLEWIYISDKFSSNADAAGQDSHTENHCSTPKATNWNLIGQMRPTDKLSIEFFKSIFKYLQTF